MYSPAWPHSEIKKIFTDIYLVTGTNKTHYNNVELQHSRNMIILRDENKLSLINTVRLDKKALKELDMLGKVENVIRIGAFHGRDDAFYLDHYQAKLFSIPGMTHENNRLADVELTNNQIPIPDASVFIFKTSIHPEGILHIDREGGILITCDSIKNWLSPDEFFNLETVKLYQEQKFFGAANISNVWQQACQVKLEDFTKLKSLTFRHLLSAHGEPILNNAKELLEKTISQM
jgi:hypothetical protein